MDSIGNLHLIRQHGRRVRQGVQVLRPALEMSGYHLVNLLCDKVVNTDLGIRQLVTRSTAELHNGIQSSAREFISTKAQRTDIIRLIASSQLIDVRAESEASRDVNMQHCRPTCKSDRSCQSQSVKMFADHIHRRNFKEIDVWAGVCT